MFFDLVLVFMMAFKLLFYLRIYDDFAMLVELIVGVWKPILPFLVFLMINVGFAEVIFIVLGANFGS